MRKNILEAAVIQSCDPIVIVTDRGIIVALNPKAHEYVNASGQVEGKLFEEVFSLQDTPPNWPAISQIPLSSGKTSFSCALKIESKTGEILQREMNVSPFQMEGEKFLTIFIRDHSERTRLEEEFLQARNMLQLVMDNIPQSIFWKDKDSRFLGCNKVCAVHAGLNSPEEIIGKTDHELPWKEEETEHFLQDDREVISTGIPRYRIIEPQLQADGTQAWLETNKFPLKDAHGNIIGLLGTYQDITERMSFSRLREDYMAALAHDLKVPIIGALRALEALQDPRLGTLETLQTEIVRKLLESHNEIYLMIQNLLDVLRLESNEQDLILLVTDVTRLTDKAVHDMVHLAQLKDLELLFFGQQEYKACVDSENLRKVIQNLVGNAIKYTPPGGRIEVTTEPLEKSWRLSIKDNGEGISQDILERLFERFTNGAQYRRPSPGFGLGLFLCKKIIEGHGGTISCFSAPGQGTHFEIILPQNQAQ